MTREDIEKNMHEAAEEIKPLVTTLVEALCDAHQKGYLAGVELGAKMAYPQWIPVEERLPEFVYPVDAEVKNTSEYVLAYNGYTMYISRLVGGKIHWWEDNSELVPTHWMPLPEAPKKGSEQCVK